MPSVAVICFSILCPALKNAGTRNHERIANREVNATYSRSGSTGQNCFHG
jgi:hypothetical protein